MFTDIIYTIEYFKISFSPTSRPRITDTLTRVLNTLAALLVRDDFAADAQESVRHACAGDVVAGGLRADGDGSEGDEEKDDLHF